MSSGITVTIEGYNELMRKFGDKIPAAVIEGAKNGVNRAVVLVEGKATNLAPVDTGDLRHKMGFDKATISGNTATGKVYNTSDHAMYVEFGTGRRGNGSYTYPTDVTLAYKDDWAGMVAQPYLGRALHTSKEQITQLVKQYTKSAMKGL